MRLLSWAIVLLAIHAEVSGQPPTEAAEAAAKNLLIAGNGGEPRTLDPHRATGVLESNILRALFEGLCSEHPSKNGVALPGVATRWEPNEDHTVWTFHLRPEATWSDGEPLTAEDFLFSYRRILTPAFKAGYAEMLYIIKGAAEYHQGTLRGFEDVGVTALDEHTLRISLREPAPFLPEIAKHFSWFPVPRHVLAKWNEGRIENPDERWTQPEHIVGNGPFVLKSWKPEEHLEVGRNPRYWDAGSVKLNGIRFLPLEDKRTEAGAFFTRKLHLTYSLPAEMRDAIRRKYPSEIHTDLYFGTRFIRCSTKRGVLKDARVRRALALALDREAVIAKVLKGGQVPAHALVPPYESYQPARHVEHDPVEAKRLLDAAGHPGGAGIAPLRLLTTDLAVNRLQAQQYRAMWKETLGITVEIEQKDWQSYLEAMATLDYDLVDAGWIGDYLDPTTFLGMWVKDGVNNRTGWENLEYEELLEQSALTSDSGERRAILQAAEKILLEEAPVIPVYWYALDYLLDERVEGWHPLLLGGHPYKFLSLTPPR